MKPMEMEIILQQQQQFNKEKCPTIKRPQNTELVSDSIQRKKTSVVFDVLNTATFTRYQF